MSDNHENVVLIKLSSGEEIISKVNDDDEEKTGKVVATDVLQVYKVNQNPFALQMSLQKWLPYTANNAVSIYFKHVVLMEQVDSELEDYYNSVVKAMHGDAEEMHRHTQKHVEDLDSLRQEYEKRYGNQNSLSSNTEPFTIH
jgi:hypothetical protein